MLGYGKKEGVLHLSSDKERKLGKPFKIAAFHGGGTWAITEVLTLIELYGEQAKGLEVLEDFDLVIGTSGGSIVLGGMLMNKTLGEIRDMFRDEKTLKSLFAKASLKDTLPHHIAGIGPKYSTELKLEGLRDALGPLGDVSMCNLKETLGLSTPVVITTLDYDTKMPAFLRTDKNSLAAGPYASRTSATLAEAIHASTTAPVNFFNRAAEIGEHRYWDGAVGGHNNPVLAGVVEARSNGVRSEDIVILSLGSGQVNLPFGTEGDDPDITETKPRESLAKNVRRLIDCLLESSAASASFSVHTMLGGRMPMRVDETIGDGPLVHFSPMIQPVNSDGKWKLPDGIEREDFNRLKALDFDARTAEEVGLIEKLVKGWVRGDVANQPIRARGFDAFCEIGHPTFASAKAHWLRLARPAPKLAAVG